MRIQLAVRLIAVFAAMLVFGVRAPSAYSAASGAPAAKRPTVAIFVYDGVQIIDFAVPFDVFGEFNRNVIAASLITPSATRGQAFESGGFVEDVNEIIRLVERYHPAPFTIIEREAWLREAHRIRSAAEAGAAPVHLAARMMEWVASLGDGHTNLEPEGIAPFYSWYPVRFHLFPDGLYITGATGAGLPLNGARIDGIGGVSAAEAVARQARLQGADNAFGAMDETYLLSNAGVMAALGLAQPNGALELTLEDSAGTRVVSLEPVKTDGFHFGWRFSGEMYGPMLAGGRSWRDWKAAYDGSPVESFRTVDPERPLHLRYRLPYHMQRIGPANDIFYYAVHFTQNWHGDDFATFANKVFAATDSVARPTLILDLRYNSGGDGSLILPIVHGIIRRPQLNHPERLFVLVGPKTFSAAVMLVGLLAEHTHATFVGTPPGAGLHHFGDARDFVLPGTGMRLYVSTLYHQYGLSTDTSPVFPIDVPAPMTAEAYFDGRDPAIDAILGSKDVRPIARIAIEHGADSARSVVDERRAVAREFGWSGWAPFRESTLKYLGYEELLQKRPGIAVKLLTLVVESYPKSWDAWDRLGQAYEEAGRVEDAIAAYRTSLKLDPYNTAGREAMQRLEEGVK